MKLKKKAKVIIFIILLIIIAIISLLVYKTYFKEEKAKEATVINEIKEYGYTLKSNKSAAYKKEFENLITILNNDSVNEEDYVKQISRMFILDFYSLSDKVANTDVGGVDFVHSAAVSNFLEKAEDTIYKYIENDMYGKRAQVLPTVDEITISDVSQTY